MACNVVVCVLTPCVLCFFVVGQRAHRGDGGDTGFQTLRRVCVLFHRTVCAPVQLQAWKSIRNSTSSVKVRVGVGLHGGLDGMRI